MRRLPMVRTHLWLTRAYRAAALSASLLALLCRPSFAQTGGKAAGAPSPASLLPASIRAAGVLRVGADAAVAPYLFTNDQGQIVGLEADFMHALGDELGVKIEITNTSFAGLVPALESGRVDVAMSDFSDTLEREKVVDYTLSGESLLVSAGNPKHIKSLADLCGKTVAVAKGTISATLAQEQAAKCAQDGKPSLNVLLFPAVPVAQLQVQDRRADATITDFGDAIYQQKRSNGLLEAAGEPFAPNYHGAAVKKGQTQLRDALQAAFKELMAKGTYRQILEKWGLQKLALDHTIVNAAATQH